MSSGHSEKSAAGVVPSEWNRSYAASLSSGSLRIEAVKNVAFAKAVKAQKVSPWTPALFKLYACLIVTYFAACTNSYNGSIMGNINSYTQFRVYLGFDPEVGASPDGLTYAIYPIGLIAGAFFVAPANDLKGRKWGLCIGASIVIIFAAVLAASQSLPMFRAARFMTGVGNTIILDAGIIYASEIAHPSFRGPMVGLYNTFWSVGSAFALFISYTCSKLDGNVAWRVPIICQMIFPVLVLVCAPFLPESPRYLLANNRTEAALDFLAKYHGEGDRESPLVQLEYQEMNADIITGAPEKRFWDIRPLFNTRETRIRSAHVVWLSFLGAWSGSGAISWYYPQMLAISGVTSSNQQLLYSGFQTIVSWVGSVLGAMVTDKVGRRPQLLYAIAVMIICLVIITPLTATNITTDNKGETVAKSIPQAKAIIALVFIFGFAYSAGQTPLQLLIPVECLRYESRAKGMAMHEVFVGLVVFCIQYGGGRAIEALGWKVYFSHIAWNVLVFGLTYFFMAETSNRTLEELTEIFQSRYPVKTSLSRSRIVVNMDNLIIDELAKDDYPGY